MEATLAPPSHVPAQRVVDFDQYNSPEVEPGIFADQERFSRRHATFGYGIHICPGVHLSYRFSKLRAGAHAGEPWTTAFSAGACRRGRALRPGRATLAACEQSQNIE